MTEASQMTSTSQAGRRDQPAAAQRRRAGRVQGTGRVSPFGAQGWPAGCGGS